MAMHYEIDNLGKFKVVRITGNIENQTSTKVLSDEISRLADQGSHHFLFDLKATDYLDSAGISVFIYCLCDAGENGGSVFCIAGDTQVRKVLEMVGLDRMMKLYSTIEEFSEAEGAAP